MSLESTTQYCVICKKMTPHQGQRTSALGELAINMITGIMTLMAASVCTPIIGWLFIPMVIMAMFIVGPFALAIGIAGTIFPKTRTIYRCTICGRIDR